MRIIALEAISLACGRGLNWVVVRLQAEGGITGLGEASHTGADDLTIGALMDHLAPKILGCDIDPNQAGTRLRRIIDGPLRPPLGSSPLTSAASGVEQAIWDLHARILNVPLATALGGQLSDRVSLYANLNRGVQERSRDGFAAAAKFAIGEGFSAVKIAPFDDVYPGLAPTALSRAVTSGLERVEAVRDAVGPDIGLLIDCHGRFDRISGTNVARTLESFEPYWLEEPVRWEEDPGGLQKIARATSIPIAAGELLVGSRPYLSMIGSDVVDVVMTDVQHCGGIATARGIASICDAASRPLSLHNPAGPVGTLASAHLTAASPGIGMLEFPLSERRRSIVEELTHDGERVVDGQLLLSDAAGIGVDLDPEALERYASIRRVEFDP